MKNKILSVGAVVLMALLASVWGADILGKWIAKEPGRQGTGETAFSLYRQAMGETVFSFKVDGTKFIGTVSDPQGETAISEGTIIGDEISFIVIRSLDGKKVKLVYKGEVALNEIKFTREVQGGMGQPQEFIAKREFQRHGDIPVQKRIMPVEPPQDKRITIPPNK